MRINASLISALLIVSCQSVDFGNESGSQADPEYARNLIRSFGSLCPSNGNWTSNSLAEARKIETVLTSLRDDPKCASVAQSVAIHVNHLQKALERIQKDSVRRDILASQRQQMDILNFLELLEDEDSEQARFFNVDALESKFGQNQLNLALNRGKLEYDRKTAQDAYTATVIVESTSQLFAQMASNQTCLLHSPQFLSGVTSLGSTVGAVLATGGASLAFAGSAMLLGNTFEFFRVSGLNKKIHQLGKGEFVSAYQCVLESLSNQWCEAQEVYDLIDLKITSRPPSINPFGQGLQILNRDLPVLISWLSQVAAATEPENTAISARQTQFIKRESALETWRYSSLGQLGDARSNLPDSLATEANRVIQFNLLKGVVRLMIPILPSPSDTRTTKSPLYDLTTSEELPWLLIGLETEDIPTSTSSTGSTIVQDLFRMTPKIFKENPKLATIYPLNPDSIKSSINKLYSNALDLLSSKRNAVLHADPRSLFWDAESRHYDTSDNIRGLSPNQAIDNILDYLGGYFGGGLPPCTASEANFGFSTNQQKIYAETQHILCRLRDQINDHNTEHITRLREIFRISNLHTGETYIKNRVQNIVQMALMDILTKEKGKGVPLQQRLLLADDIILELEQQGSSNLTQVKLDIKNALQNSQNTLQNFTEIFSESIADTVREVHKNTMNHPSSGALLAKYCSLLLAVPDWSSEEVGPIDISLCYGNSLRSEWKETEEAFEFTFSKEVFHSPVGRRRICHFRRFLRQEQFYQNYGVSGEL